MELQELIKIAKKLDTVFYSYNRQVLEKIKLLINEGLKHDTFLNNWDSNALNKKYDYTEMYFSLSDSKLDCSFKTRNEVIKKLNTVFHGRCELPIDFLSEIEVEVLEELDRHADFAFEKAEEERKNKWKDSFKSNFLNQ